MVRAGDSEALTCISCHLMFSDPDQHREHYKSDFHRYNLKRKVANLPPLTQQDFDQKLALLTREAVPAPASAAQNCDICNKVFRSNNAFSTHLKSKKHKDLAAQVASAATLASATSKGVTSGVAVLAARHPSAVAATAAAAAATPAADATHAPADADDDDEDEAAVAVQAPTEVQFVARGGARHLEAPERELERELRSEVIEAAERAAELLPEEQSPKEFSQMSEEEMIQHKLATAVHLKPEQCIFCCLTSADFETNLDHMTLEHGFFIPDVEYLTSVQGLLSYLGEKISVGNVCLYCNGRGRQYHSMVAVQKHMRDVNHCKIRTEDDDDDDELSEFYDYSLSYPTDAKSGDATPMAVEPKSRVARVSESGHALVFENGKEVGHRDYRVYFKQAYRSDQVHEAVALNRLMSKYKALGWTTAGALSAQGNPFAGLTSSQTRILKKQQRQQQRHEKWHMQDVAMKIDQRPFNQQNICF